MSKRAAPKSSIDMDSRFFSLRWKLTIFLVLLSLALTALLTEFFQLYLLDRYNDSRRQAIPQYARQINGLIGQQRHHLEQVTMTLPTLSGVRGALAKNRLDEFKTRFGDFWSSFQLDMGLDDAHYFDHEGKELASWENGPTGSLKADAERWERAWRETVHNESSDSFTACSDACRIHALAPVLVNGKLAGQFAVGASLAETVLAFRNTSHADIAILSAIAHPRTEATGADALARRWGVRVEAASNAVNTLNVLRQASARFDLPHPGAGAVRLEAADGGIYEIAELSLTEDNRAKGMHLLLVEEIGAGLAEVRDTTRRSLLLSLLGGFLSLSLLYVLSGRSLKRLLRTASAIPLLGRSEFAALRDSIEPREKKRTHDEIDLLDRTAIVLSHRLETLEAEVAEHADSLQKALREASMERAFVASLLDHAQAIIVTCDRQGRILSLNRYGRELAGYAEIDVHGLLLVGSPLIRNAGAELAERLKELSFGLSEHLRHEAQLQCYDGGSREISWVHTHLHGDGAASLLSVGLDITERKQNELRLAFLADHDPLTGCFNRRRFHAELERMILDAQRSSLAGALLFLDLDRFKYLNDTSGHQAGDNLLLLVAYELRKLLESCDIIGRLGGDEFAIATLGTDERGAIALAERINRALSEISYPGLGINHRVTASIGIALFPGENLGVRDLLVNADIAMYQAKENGRTGWHLFSSAEKRKERMHEWIVWEERIKRALAHDGFELHFQPVMKIADRTVRHYEVLLRLRLADGGLAYPGAFMEIAEHSGLIREIDTWVVRKSIAHLLSLPPARADLSYAINLSGVSMGDDNLLNELRRIFRETPLDPRRIIFEITETAAVADLSRAREFVNEIKTIGCAFALDDFGSGFASFFYLKQFPVDILKIDGSFIRNLADNRDDQIFVRAMVEIAKAYGKKTVAEFVENQATLKLLEEYGVDYAQGYFVGKPGPSPLPAPNGPASPANGADSHSTG
jgi:diguanylate cyclase (GGDEF)-like protein/PAS domain S-box-containing protein